MSAPSSGPGELGALTVGLARRAVDLAVAEGLDDPGRRLAADGPADERLRAVRGVFVTLETFPEGRLRGCIGFPLPILRMEVAIPRAAAAAAREDPRFPPVRRDEVDRLTVEVSVLTPPERLEGPPEERPRAVRVGVDGLIVDADGGSGLLLPQVAPEQGWSAEEFLAGTCEKAGIASSAWRRPATIVRRFQASVARESRPRGPAVRSLA